MYQHAKDVGITLITISLRCVLPCKLCPRRLRPQACLSHSFRPSLVKYHTRLLSLSGDKAGSWTITRVGTAEERMGIHRDFNFGRAVSGGATVGDENQGTRWVVGRIEVEREARIHQFIKYMACTHHG